MAVQDNTPVINVSKTQKCTSCRPKSNLTLHFLENLFFSPVLHCTPHDLPHVVVRFIIDEFQPKNCLKMRSNECRQHCQSLLNKEVEYCPYVSPEFWIWVLQWVAIDTEGTGRYDVSGESGHRLIHLYSGKWETVRGSVTDKIFIY